MGFFDLFDDAPPPREIPADAPLPCWECPACEKVLEGKCPDVHVIGRDGKASIGVEAIRFLRSDVLIPPNDLDTKVYIIEDAETMTVQAQNALLLTLEEPPSYVLFLLLCDGADHLLETIRSRAPVLRTRPIPDSDIREYLRARRCTLSEEDMETVILRADGCIGQFMEVMAARRYDTLPAILSRFGNKRDGVSELLALVTLATRDLILLRHGDGESVRLKYYTDRIGAEELSCRFTTKSLLSLYNALGRAADALEANSNIRLTLMGMAVELGN